MAVNCVVIRGGTPMALGNERFDMAPGEISIEVSSGEGLPGLPGNYDGKGKLFVSNFRLVFLKKQPDTILSSIALPYELMLKHKLKTPLFGSPHIKIQISSIKDAGLFGVAKVTLQFPNPGVARNVSQRIEQQRVIVLQAPASSGHLQASKTPMLPIQSIFPDQYPNHQNNMLRQEPRLPRQKSTPDPVRQNSLQRMNGAPQSNGGPPQQLMSAIPSSTVVAAQTPNDAPSYLTREFRPHQAKLFSTSAKPSAPDNGPIIGASPVSWKPKYTVIQDADNYPSNTGLGAPQSMSHARSAPGPHYQTHPQPVRNQAYFDPNNPDDVLLVGGDTEGLNRPYNQTDTMASAARPSAPQRAVAVTASDLRGDDPVIRPVAQRKPKPYKPSKNPH